MSEADQTDLIRPIKLYVRDFALWYICLAVLIAIISINIDVALAVRLLTTFVAASLVAGRFLKQEKRAPTDQEKHGLTNGSIIVWLGFNIVVEGLKVMKVLEGNPEVGGFYIVLVTLPFVTYTVLNYMFLLLSYGWLARIQAKRLAAKR